MSTSATPVNGGESFLSLRSAARLSIEPSLRASLGREDPSLGAVLVPPLNRLLRPSARGGPDEGCRSSQAKICPKAGDSAVGPLKLQTTESREIRSSVTYERPCDKKLGVFL